MLVACRPVYLRLAHTMGASNDAQCGAVWLLRQELLGNGGSCLRPHLHRSLARLAGGKTGGAPSLGSCLPLVSALASSLRSLAGGLWGISAIAPTGDLDLVSPEPVLSPSAAMPLASPIETLGGG